MTAEKEKILIDKYPSLFRDKDKPMTETCMCWGCSCEDGWFHILDDMCESLIDLQTEYDVEITFSQIKEKYGVLSVYYNFTTGKRWSLVDGNHLLDGNMEMDKVSMGWASHGEKVNLYRNVQDQIDEIIRMAEKFSSITCEKCGMTGGKANPNGWIKTLCEKCRGEAE